MERIKQAVEKAKKQQLGHAAQLQPKKELEKDAPHITEHVQNELLEVSYKYTRVVKLNVKQLEANRIFAFNKNDPLSLAFDVLRTQILQKMDEQGWRTLAITSPTPAVGKTVVAINLAMSIAQKTDRSAILVDFDLRQPRIGSYLGLPMENSLNDLLDKNTGLADILVNPGIERLVIAPTRHAVMNPAETLSSGKVSDLIREIRERYESRIVIIDLPSLLHSDDAISVLPQVDSILMVVANGMATSREIENSLRHLSKANLIGTVFNKA